MDTDTRKNAVREFCEKDLVEFLLRNNHLKEFRYEYRIAYVELTWDYSEPELLSPEIVRPPQNLPKNILDTFERHLWYSRHNISDIYLLKIPIDDQEVFFFVIQGHCHDAWDNACLLVEVLDEQGRLLGAGRLRDQGWGEDGILKQYIDWIERQLDGRDYYKTAPPWPGEPPPEDFDYRHWWIPIWWSEESE